MRSARHPMLPTHADAVVRFPQAASPRLVIIVDAEEEFDWSQPFSRGATGVTSMAQQWRVQEIYKRYGIVPTYAIDYPVAAQEDGYRPLLEFLKAGGCEIGAQLHPWVTPPLEEEISERNSFAGNLGPELEKCKLEVLTETIVRNLGVRPILYRAGRYGAGPNTASILEELGYQIDCSVFPGMARAYSPDYKGGTADPYWIGGDRSIFEIPVTTAFIGVARGIGDALYPKIDSPVGRTLKFPAIMARLRLLDRIRVSPEGITLTESKRLTRDLVARGHKVFALSYHSPSLEPGHTPYVRNKADLATFLSWIEGYLEFFFGEMQGVADTPRGIREWALSLEL